MLGCCFIIGKTGLTLAIATAQQSFSGVAGMSSSAPPLQAGVGHCPARHNLAPSIREDVAGRMWPAGPNTWLSSCSEMRDWLILGGDKCCVGCLPYWRGWAEEGEQLCSRVRGNKHEVTWGG